MMAAPTNHWKLGLFVVVGLALALGAVGWLGAGSLRRDVGRYVSYFDESVQGLEVALAGKAFAIVTGNVRDYPLDLGFEVLPPATVLARLGLDG